MEFHEIANIFPLMEGEEYKALVNDIRENGLLNPIWAYDNKIIDGRNRWRACKDAGVEPKFREWTGDSLVSFVISVNVSRRHLTSSQRAAAAVDILPFFEKQMKELMCRAVSQYQQTGEVCTKNLQSCRSTEHAAKLLSTNHVYVSEAKKLSKEAPQLLEEVRGGKLTIPQAKRQLIKDEIKPVPDLPKGKYSVILADPPWQYWTGGDKNQSMHYKTMTLDEIREMDIQSISNDNCILFLWVTAPILKESFRVIESWGFKYSTVGFVWVKKTKDNNNFFGCGSWTRANAEYCLIATKGSIERKSASISQIIESIPGRHSEKPDIIYDKIIELVGDLPKIELFARNKKAGWEVWGDECP